MYPTRGSSLLGLAPLSESESPQMLHLHWEINGYFASDAGVNLTRIRPNYYAQHRCHGVSLQMGRESISLQVPDALWTPQSQQKGIYFQSTTQMNIFQGQSDYNPNPNQVKKEEYIYVKTTKDKCKYRCNSSKPMGTWCQYSSSFICFKLILK